MAYRNLLNTRAPASFALAYSILPMSRGNYLPSMAELQQADYGENRDYEVGSPHLRHDVRRNRIENDLSALVRDQVERRGQCRVLEIGGGHGTFTACLVAAGASVIVTEMSAPVRTR